MEARIDRRRDLQLDQERRRARVQHGRVWRSVEGRGHLEGRELRAVSGEKQVEAGDFWGKKVETGDWGLEKPSPQPPAPSPLQNYFDSEVGPIWNFTSLL